MSLTRGGVFLSDEVLEQCTRAAFMSMSEEEDSEDDGDSHGSSASNPSTNHQNGRQHHHHRHHIAVTESYEAILLVFHHINDSLQIQEQFMDPPTREEVKKRIKSFRPSQPGRLSQPEFHSLCLKFFTPISLHIAKEAALAFVITPALTWATKRSLNAALSRAGMKTRVPSVLAGVVVCCIFGIVRMLTS